jgi:hypothetical protein
MQNNKPDRSMNKIIFKNRIATATRNASLCFVSSSCQYFMLNQTLESIKRGVVACKYL